MSIRLARRCPVCHKKSYYQFNLKEFNLYQCSWCLHQFFFPYLNQKSLKKIYERSEYFYDGQKFPLPTKQNYQNFPQYKTLISRLSEICSLNTLKHPKILDVGCGTGLFVKLCNQKGIQTMGIDFSRMAIKIARKLESNCYQKDFLKDISDSHSNVVTMFDVLEHLINPSAFLKKAYDALKKNGILVLTTPKADSFACKIFKKRWHLYTPPRHLQIFSSQSIRLLLEKQGFRILKMKNQGQWTNLGYVISKMLSIYNLNSKFIEKFLHRVGIYRLNLYFNLFDVMTVFAQKVNFTCKKRKINIK